MLPARPDRYPVNELPPLRRATPAARYIPIAHARNVNVGTGIGEAGDEATAHPPGEKGRRERRREMVARRFFLPI